MQKTSVDGQGIVIFDFQRHITYREQRALPIKLNVEGVSYSLETPDDFSAFANEHFTEQSWLERKYMSFRVVNDPYPGKCRH